MPEILFISLLVSGIGFDSTKAEKRLISPLVSKHLPCSRPLLVFQKALQLTSTCPSPMPTARRIAAKVSIKAMALRALLGRVAVQ